VGDNPPNPAPTAAALSDLEKLMAGVMFVVGLGLVVGGLLVFGSAKPREEGDNPFAFKSKEKVIEEPRGEGQGHRCDSQ
jgi:hypothetical protein